MLFSSHHAFGSFFVYSFHLEAFITFYPKISRWTGLADCELVLCRLGLGLEGEGFYDGGEGVEGLWV